MEVHLDIADGDVWVRAGFVKQNVNVKILTRLSRHAGIDPGYRSFRLRGETKRGAIPDSALFQVRRSCDSDADP